MAALLSPLRNSSRLRCLSTRILGGEAMDANCQLAFDTWHSCVKDVAAGKAVTIDAASTDRLRAVVADDCVHAPLRPVAAPALRDVAARPRFRPPTYFKPWTGGDETTVLLSCAAEVFGESFTYKRQWLSADGRDWALEFEATIADTGKRIDGIDLVQLDAQGKICDFTVLARPPNGVAARAGVRQTGVISPDPPLP